MLNAHWRVRLDGASKEGSQLREKIYRSYIEEKKERKRIGKTKRKRGREIQTLKFGMHLNTINAPMNRRLRWRHGCILWW